MKPNLSARLSFILILACVIMRVTVISQAQQLQGTKGQPLIADTSTSAKTDAPGTIVDVYVQAAGISGDMCAKIASSWGTYPNATLDARGFLGQQKCASSPFPSTSVKGKLLLGNARIETKVQWAVPSGVEIQGLGVSAPSGDGLSEATPINTVIQADTGFTPTNAALVEMGTGSGA